jgi:hypothetical protein
MPKNNVQALLKLANSAHHLFFLGQSHAFGNDRPILCFLVVDTFKLSTARGILGVQRLSELSSFALMEMLVFSSREIVQLVLARTAARIKSFCFSRGTSARTSR